MMNTTNPMSTVVPDPPGGQAEAESSSQVTSPQIEASPDTTPASNAKVLTIPSNAMARIKREEREKGKKGATIELEAQAKRLGFSSVEEMMKAAAQFKRSSKSGSPARPQATASAQRQESKPAVVAPAPLEARPLDRSLRRSERDREKALEEVRRLNRARANEEKRRKDAERRLSAMEAEMTLRTAAVRAGVQDIDYALELLKRKVGGKTAEDLKTFNEDDFFAKELRSSHPYLYGITEQPANTSAGGAVREAPKPAVRPAVQAAPSNGAVDAKSLTPAEYQKLLSQYGIKNPTLGM
jgi:hypothetical protein